MAQKVSTVAAHIAALPAERRSAIRAVRAVVRRNLPRGFVEQIAHGMIAWVVPLSRWPRTYNGEPLMIAALASRPSTMSLYLMGVYGNAKLASWFRAGFARAGKTLRMGKSCVRFRRLEDLALDVIGAAIARVGVDDLIAVHEKARAARGRR